MSKRWFLCGLFVLTLTAVHANAPSKYAATYDLTPIAEIAQLAPTSADSQLLPLNAPLRVRWTLPLPECQVKRLILPPNKSDLNYFLVETLRHDLIAVRSDNGEPLWWLRAPSAIAGDVAFGDDYLYFIIANRLVSLDRLNGEVMYNVNLPFAPSAGPAVYETNDENDEKTAQIFIPAMDRKIYCIKVLRELWPPKTSKILSGDFSTVLPVVRELWHYGMTSVAESSPLYNPSDNWLYVAGSGKRLYGIDLEDLAASGAPDENKIWQFATKSGMSAAPVQEGPNVLFAARDQTLYCLDGKQGGIAWTYIAEDTLETSPQILEDEDNDKIYVIQRVGNAGLVGLNNKRGTPWWQIANGLAVVGVIIDEQRDPLIKQIAVVLDRDGNLIGIYPAAPDKRTPAEKAQDDAQQRAGDATTAWKIPVGERFKLFANNTAVTGESTAGLIFCTTLDGGTVCVLEKNQ